MKKCGILFNAKQNYFLPYLKWIIEECYSNDYFELSGIHTNDLNTLNEELDDLHPSISLNEILKESDVVFSLGYWRILRKDQISNVPLGIVNFHHSYKLKYRGRHCSTWALRNNESIHGSTMHFIDENLDEGKIIATDYFSIDRTDVAEDLFFKANNIGLQLLKNNFRDVLFEETNTVIPLEKDYKCFKEKDLDHKISNEHVMDEDKLLTEIRALTFDLMPAPYIELNGQKVYLKLESYDDGVLGRLP